MFACIHWFCVSFVRINMWAYGSYSRLRLQPKPLAAILSFTLNADRDHDVRVVLVLT